MSEFSEKFAQSVAAKLAVSKRAQEANQALALQESRFRPGEENVCPSCGGTSWWVGRITATCGSCQTPLDIMTNTALKSGTARITHRSTEDATRGRFVINGRF